MSKKPSHLTRRQWGTLQKARELSEREGLYFSKLDNYYLRNEFSEKGLHKSIVAKLRLDYEVAKALYEEFTNTKEYKNAVEADTFK